MINFYLESKNHIYGLAHTISKPGMSQAVLIRTMQSIEAESVRNGASDEETLRNLLNPIFDGLNYGNWPK